MQKNNKWFTLVELIVVIAILSVLTTVSFISFSWHTTQARDSQRISDLTVLNNSIKTLSLKWFSVKSIVEDDSNTWSWEFYFWWKNLTWNPNYKAWDINFLFLKDINEDILDPSLWVSYKLWVFNSNYELWASLEESNTSYLITSSRKRTWTWSISSLTGSIDMLNNKVQLLNIENSLMFEIWDFIWTWTTTSREVIDIVWDSIYLDDVRGISIIDKIRLFHDDTWIIWNAQTWDWNQTDCSSMFNVKENICPLKLNVEWLLPYSFE